MENKKKIPPQDDDSYSGEAQGVYSLYQSGFSKEIELIGGDRQIDNIDIDTDMNTQTYKVLAYVVMQTEKSQDLQQAIRRPRRATVQFQSGSEGLTNI